MPSLLAELCVMQGLRLKNFENFYKVEFPSNPPVEPDAAMMPPRRSLPRVCRAWLDSYRVKVPMPGK